MNHKDDIVVDSLHSDPPVRLRRRRLLCHRRLCRPRVAVALVSEWLFNETQINRKMNIASARRGKRRNQRRTAWVVKGQRKATG
jgi:hypothetical protein